MFDVAIVGAGPSRARASSCSTDRTRSKQMEGHLATAQKYLPLGFVLAFAFSAGHQTVLRAGSDAKEFAFTTVDVSGTSTLARVSTTQATFPGSSRTLHVFDMGLCWGAVKGSQPSSIFPAPHGPRYGASTPRATSWERTATAPVERLTSRFTDF